MLNKAILMKLIQEYIEEETQDHEYTRITDINYLHDCFLDLTIAQIPIGEYDALYHQMNSILNANGEEMLKEIEEYEDEFLWSPYPYFGDDIR